MHCVIEAKPFSVRGAGKTRATKSRPLCTLGKERVDTERRKQTKRPVTQTAKKPGGTCVSVCVGVCVCACVVCKNG